MRSLTSGEILEKVSDSSIQKANSSAWKLFILAVLAGAFLAFGANGSMTVSFGLVSDPATFGIGKLISAMVFPVGLMMVVLCGAELFTGNNLMIIGLLDGKIKVSGMLRNWIIVYIGNMAGSVLIALLINYSGLLESGGGMLGAVGCQNGRFKSRAELRQSIRTGDHVQLAGMPGCMDGNRRGDDHREDILDTVLHRSVRAFGLRAQCGKHVFHTCRYNGIGKQHFCGTAGDGYLGTDSSEFPCQEPAAGDSRQYSRRLRLRRYRVLGMSQER